MIFKNVWLNSVFVFLLFFIIFVPNVFSQAWNLDSGYYAVNSYDTRNEELGVKKLYFSPNGLNLYIVGEENVAIIHYSLSVPWDLDFIDSSYSFDLNVDNGNPMLEDPKGLFFNNTGTKMFVLNSGDRIGVDWENNPNHYRIYSYNLNTPWDLNSANYDSNFDFGAVVDVDHEHTTKINGHSLLINNTGSKLYVGGWYTNSIYEFDFTNNWDITSLVYNDVNYNFDIGINGVSLDQDGIQGLSFNCDGNKLFVIVDSDHSIYEFDLSNPWDLSESNVTYSGNSYDLDNINNTQPRGLFFKTDGSKFFTMKFHETAPLIQEFNLQNNWSLDGEVYFKDYLNFNEFDNVFGVLFNEDGTKLYVGNYGDHIYQYNVLKPWVISSAQYDNKSLDFTDKDTAMRSFYINSDGNKLFLVGSNSDKVYDYNLNTPWDIGSAIFDSNFSISSQEDNVRGLFFKDDGSKFFIFGLRERLYQYNLTTNWDIDSATVNDNYLSFSGAITDNQSRGLFFSNDGSQFYVVDDGEDLIKQFDLITPWSVDDGYNNNNLSLTTNYSNSGYPDEGSPRNIFIDSTGSKLFLGSYSSNILWQYSLFEDAGSIEIDPSEEDHNNSVEVSLDSEKYDYSIMYTLDGSEPTKINGLLYNNPISLDTEGITTLKARIWSENSLVSDIFTKDYNITIIEESEDVIEENNSGTSGKDILKNKGYTTSQIDLIFKEFNTLKNNSDWGYKVVNWNNKRLDFMSKEYPCNINQKCRKILKTIFLED